MGEGDYNMIDEWYSQLSRTNEGPGSSIKTVMILESEYLYYRDLIKTYEKISKELLTTWYGDDVPMLKSALNSVEFDRYAHTVKDVISTLRKSKKNIFYRIWRKIMKW